jgi:hypothetical protein
MRKKFNPFLIIISAAVLVISTATGVIIYNNMKTNEVLNDFSIVATVSGVPITYREYMRSLIAVRSDIISYFTIRGADQGNENFWHTPIGNETPIENLKKAALERAVKYKLIQIFAKEKGIIDDIRYETFVAGLETENKRRETALANGEPIYGPKQYTEQIYYDLMIAETETLIQKAIAGENLFSEEEMYRIYETDWKNQATEAGWIQVIKLFAPFSQYNEQSVQISKAVMDRIYERIIEGADFETAAAEEQNVEIIDQYLDLRRGAGDEMRRASIFVAEFYEIGDISGVYEDYRGYSILKCVNRNEVTYHTYEGIKDIINARLAEDEYCRLLSGKIGQAKVKTNDRIYTQIDEMPVI